MKVLAAHASMQSTDPDKQHLIDVEAIFKRARDKGYAWISGTEAGRNSGNLTDLLHDMPKNYGFRSYVPASKEDGPNTDCWTAVSETFIDGRPWRTNFEPAIPSSGVLYKEAGVKVKPDFPKWGPRGLVNVSFQNSRLGVINVGAAHYLTHARDPENSVLHGIDHWEWNKKLAEVIAAWGRRVGKGSSLAFYSGDQNMLDSKNNQPQGDTFMGGPFTSMADELEAWQNTGSGPIDVMASYNGDGRVTALKFNVLDDTEFFLNNDHFLCEGIYDIKRLDQMR